MAAYPSHKHQKMSPLHQELHEISSALHGFYRQMKSNKEFCPSVQQLDLYAKKIIAVASRHDKECEKGKAFLKNAIIDLTEIPVMHEKHQRMAIETALRMACENLDSFFAKAT
jgi:hypothetical protein